MYVVREIKTFEKKVLSYTTPCHNEPMKCFPGKTLEKGLPQFWVAFLT